MANTQLLHNVLAGSSCPLDNSPLCRAHFVASHAAGFCSATIAALNLMRAVGPQIKSVKQPVQFLRGKNNHFASDIRRSFESLGFKAFEPKAEAVALPVQDFHTVAGLFGKYEGRRVEDRHLDVQLN